MKENFNRKSMSSQEGKEEFAEILNRVGQRHTSANKQKEAAKEEGPKLEEFASYGRMYSF